jgi:hypothetical protein
MDAEIIDITNLDNSDKTWDGYGKFNNIPINPDTK